MSTTRKTDRSSLSNVRPLDLKLVCASSETVLVCSKLLMSNTRSSAIEDIISTLRDANPAATCDCPMELPVTDDSAATWKVVWKLVEAPLVDSSSGLSWDNLQAVISLADKYDLPLPLLACQMFILAADGGYMDNWCKHQPRVGLLTIMELLLRAQMDNAYTRLLPYCYQSASSAISCIRLRSLASDKGSTVWVNSISREAVEAANTTASVVKDLTSYQTASSDPVTASQVQAAVLKGMLRQVIDLVPDLVRQGHTGHTSQSATARVRRYEVLLYGLIMGLLFGLGIGFLMGWLSH